MRRFVGLVLGAVLAVGGVQASAQAAAPKVNVETNLIDCGWDPVSRTLWPTVKVKRTSGAADNRVTGRALLMRGATIVTTLGVGRVHPDGSVNQNGFVDGPVGTTGISPLAVGTPEWIRPWGGRFGDGSAGGAPLTPGQAFTVRFILFDLDAGENEIQDIACAAAGPFAITPTTHSTTALATRTTKVTLAEVVTAAGTHGKTTKSCSPPAAGVTGSFCWSDAGTGDADDFNSSTWYPQGLAGSGESGPNGGPAWSGVPAGKDLLIASWYRRGATDDAPARGTRLSLVDLSLATPKYLHLELWAPCSGGVGCVAGFTPLLDSHVGGLAWAGRYVHVAETDLGFRTFDLTRIFRLGSGATARYLLPQVTTYRQTDTCPSPVGGLPTTKPCALKFSFASVVNGAPYRLVSGEFHKTDDHARIVSWPLLADGRLATAAADRNRQKDELVAGEDLVKFQGVAAAGQRTVISSSYGNGNAGERFKVTTGPPNVGAITVPQPTGVEDLFSSQGRNQVWALAEFPGKRWVWSTTFVAVF